MHAISEVPVEIIADAVNVELLLFSPDGDPMGTEIVSKAEAVRLVRLPPMMGHTRNGP